MAEVKPAEKLPLFGVGISPTTYAEATAVIIESARSHTSFGLSALATHGLMYAVLDSEFAEVLAHLDLVTPDGQPVRWAMNILLGTGLTDRVYGPTLTALVCAEAERAQLSVYLFGSTEATCTRLTAALGEKFPKLRIAGVQPDRFREATTKEDEGDVARIIESGANIILVGRGCPRQERWVDAHLGVIPAAMLAVGAAFDYLAGTLKPPPHWMQDAGLEWMFRLYQEPQRLWRRYLWTNTYFVVRFVGAWSRKRYGELRSQLGRFQTR